MEGTREKSFFVSGSRGFRLRGHFQASDDIDKPVKTADGHCMKGGSFLKSESVRTTQAGRRGQPDEGSLWQCAPNMYVGHFRQVTATVTTNDILNRAASHSNHEKDPG